LKKPMTLTVALLLLVTLVTPVQSGVLSEDIDDLTADVNHWIDNSRHGRMYVCGKQLSAEERQEYIQEWATTVLETREELQYTLYIGDTPVDTKIPLEEIKGVMGHESGLDRCAIGLYTRQWAYNEKLLTPGRMSISHTEEDVLRVIQTKAWRARWKRVDLGLGQLLWGPGKQGIFRGDPKELLSLTPGIRHVLEEMAARGVRFNTLTPAKYWPGHKSETYYKRILMFNRRMTRPKVS